MKFEKYFFIFNIRKKIILEKKNREKKVSDMIRHVGLESVRDQYPDFLSGGEQQRVAIARALIHDPEIIIADEPTGNLDPDLSNTILKLFYEFSKKGMTFFVATHDYRLIDKTKCRLLKVDKGQLIEDSSI